ncbi:MAG: carbohydrate kinase [Oscillospiraceae bacterium]|nr:carbohydrate kinase [Oscillospiraceae bacterium]
MKYFMGLDNGGTATKAALYDAKGNEIKVASVSTAMITPAPGYVERDMDEMWQANCRVIRTVVEESGVDPKDIAGVGIAGHGKGLYLWGRDEKPLGYGIISTDNRAWEYPVKWAADGTEEKVFQLSCQHILACQPVSLLAWMKDNQPERYKDIKWVFACKDYVRFRLTGEARAEITDYSGANLMNLHTRDYDKNLLDLFGIGEVFDALPPLCKGTEIAGQVSAEAAAQCGLAEGTPVIGGMFDIDACALSVGITDEENICMIAGTWSINEYIRRTPVLDGKVMLNSLFCLPEYYLIEECSPTSAGNNEWFINQLLPEVKAAAKQAGTSIYDQLNQWVESIAPEEFVPVYLPFLMGSNAHPNAKGTFVGLSTNHTRKHMLRSVYEGIAFCHRHHFDKLMATRETAPKCIRLAGGAARSTVWTQMFADIMNMPIVTVDANETGALGCAISVAAATGEYASLAEAAANMSSFSAPVYPNPEKTAIYEKKYQLYRKAIECLDGLWPQMQDLIDGN